VSGWSGTRVLVTGAGGFIGSHVCERLVELGARVRALVEYDSLGSWGWLDESPAKQHLEVVSGDVRDRDGIVAAAGDADRILHLAALIAIPYSYTAPASYVETNVMGTLNVLRAAQAAGVERIVHTSTSEVYGSARSIPIDEEHPLQGQSPYSASKIGADKIAESFHLSFGVPVITLRPFNTYGPRQSARAVIPTVITQLQSGGEVALGNLAPTRDFTFVTDTAEAFALAGASADAVGQVLNTGSGREISIGDLVQRIGGVLGVETAVRTEEQRVRPRRSEVDRLCADASRAREVLGWEPRVGLDEGIARTAEWLERNRHRYRPGVYTV
jgi:NAD dependent epimerase/dehydratase